MPPRDRTADRRDAAAERFYRYQAEIRETLDAARQCGDRGLWEEAANKCNAALMTLGAMSGVCREMHLYVMLREER